ncbi:hypothetical protein Grass_173 [Bacillus phage Grass]|uniref:Uncharacterized protein n=1 Tax=Bacillus phage Grass TaxID=1406785 RepID=U5PY85_BPGRA|nr:hypothetical protein Grass_173 [Bacillus phage Grass]AGY47438.1 hypothetical protein Grass_173 [Bacillus phage Grass]
MKKSGFWLSMPNLGKWLIALYVGLGFGHVVWEDVVQYSIKEHPGSSLLVYVSAIGIGIMGAKDIIEVYAKSKYQAGNEESNRRKGED